VLAPAQALGQEDLVDPAALDRDPFVLVQVGRQPVQRPRRERQVQALGLGQCGGDHPRHLLGRVGRWAAAARAILKATEARGVEALDPVAHRVGSKTELVGNARHVLALAGVPDDACPLDLPCGCGARMGQPLDRDPFLLRQLTQP
jgi:hypothetical protein